MDTRKYCVTYHPIKGDSMTSKLYFMVSEPGLIARDVPTLKDGTYDESVIIDQVMRQFKEFYAEITTRETVIIPEVVSISQVPVHDTSNVDPQDPKLMKVMTEYMDHADSMEELLLSHLAEGEAFTDEELQNLIDRVGDTEYLAPEDLRGETQSESPLITKSGYLRLTELPNWRPVYIEADQVTEINDLGPKQAMVRYSGRNYDYLVLVREDADSIARCLDQYKESTNG